MWYLIVPPIIVVLSLSFVLWYLAKKSADPLIVARASKLGADNRGSVSFVRTKAFSLHLLEKVASRFKVFSLRMHNALHTLIQSLKESQKRFHIKAPLNEVIDHTPSASPIGVSTEEPLKHKEMKRRFFAKVPERKIGITEDALREKEVQKSTPRDVEETDFAQPMVSATAIYPEETYRRARTNNAREEDFIARIASNPKDFAAYEGLGDYYMENNNIKDAKECYRQVLKLSPVQRMVKIKIRRLEKLLTQKTN